MAPLAPPDQNRLVETIHQSPPVDLTRPYDPSTLRGKTILVTGGSSGLGAAFARHWAAHGANLIIGDINDTAGEALVAELRTSTAAAAAAGGGSSHHNHHFVHVDVTDWPSQAALFQEAVRLSPSGHLDAVVASAGISDSHGAATGLGFENPAGLDRPGPSPPDLRCIGVNLIGVMYTAHLALFWLQQDARPGAGGGGRGGGDGRKASQRKQQEQEEEKRRVKRDRHFLMVGSYAGLTAIPGVPEYVASKHGVTGLFRSLRTLSYRQGVRVNLLCPYFVDTPIIGNQAMALLAGLGLARLEDVVDAATRLMADDGGGPAEGGSQQPHGGRIAGRALCVGPRLSLLRARGGRDVLPAREIPGGEGEGGGVVDITARDGDVLVDDAVRLGQGQAAWECYAHDYDTVDFFVRRYVRVLNTVAAVKGWAGWARDLWHALFVRKGPGGSSSARVG